MEAVSGWGAAAVCVQSNPLPDCNKKIVDLTSCMQKYVNCKLPLQQVTLAHGAMSCSTLGLLLLKQVYTHAARYMWWL